MKDNLEMGADMVMVLLLQTAFLIKETGWMIILMVLAQYNGKTDRDMKVLCSVGVCKKANFCLKMEVNMLDHSHFQLVISKA